MFVAAWLAAVAFHQPLPTIPELLEKVAAGRRGFTQYEIVIDGTRAVNMNANLAHFWRDGDWYRRDFSQDFVGNDSARMIECDHAEREGMYFSVSYDRPFQFNHAGSFGPMQPRRRYGDDRPKIEEFGATHETVLGSSLRGLGYWTRMSVWTVKVVRAVRWNGERAYAIRMGVPCHSSSGMFEAVLLPEKGYAVAFARMTWTDEQGQTVETTTASAHAVIRGVWLPTLCVNRETLDGRAVRGLAQFIRYESLCRPIDPKAFTLAGMGLIPSTLVSTEGGLMKWDGEKLGPARVVAGPPPAPKPAGDPPP